jgi:four helix bundle protein
MLVMIKSFKELIVWQKAFALTVKVYKYTMDFPPSEKYGLVSQMRRAAVSDRKSVV